MLCAFCMQFTSCRTVETQSPVKHYKIIVVNDAPVNIKLFIKGAEGYSEIFASENTYSVHIPAMRGGYSDFLGFRFNKHNPERYKILKVMNNNAILQEFSIEEIELFNKDEKGNYILILK